MEKFYNAVCWTGLGILVIFGVPIFLFRYVVTPLWGMVWLFRHSPLPVWERAFAATAIIAGFAYLMAHNHRRRIPQNRNFVYYTSGTQEERSSTSSKTEDL
jgi:hypothetical protein